SLPDRPSFPTRRSSDLHSVLDWDILFLLPLPWWGPVLAPMSIALLMILWGTVVNSTPTQGTTCSAERKAWVVNIFGVALALYVRSEEHTSELQSPDHLV